MRCPACDHRLPVDGVTECDRCGAHLEVYVKTAVPPIDDVDKDNTEVDDGRPCPRCGAESVFYLNANNSSCEECGCKIPNAHLVGP